MKILMIALTLALAASSLVAQDIAFCNDGPLRLRKSPALDAPVLGSVDTYEKVLVLEQSAKAMSVDGFESYWYRIRGPAGLEGWAFGGYLEIFDAGARSSFNGVFSMELPRGSKIASYPAVVHAAADGFVVTRLYSIRYLGRSFDLLAYYVPLESTRLEAVIAKLKPVVRTDQPALGLERLEAMLDFDPSYRQSSDWTNVQLTAASVNSDTVHDVLVARIKSSRNPMFGWAFLVFQNMWIDSGDYLVTQMELRMAIAEIERKKLGGQNYEMVLNAIGTINLVDGDE